MRSPVARIRQPWVLIVDDDPICRLITEAQLRDLGYRFATACSGREALSALGKRRFGAVLMDCQMPEIDGYETTRRLRELSSCSCLPVIALTAHFVTDGENICLQAGMDAYLNKPTRIDDLAAVLDRWAPLASKAGDRLQE